MGLVPWIRVIDAICFLKKFVGFSQSPLDLWVIAYCQNVLILCKFFFLYLWKAGLCAKLVLRNNSETLKERKKCKKLFYFEIWIFFFSKYFQILPNILVILPQHVEMTEYRATLTWPKANCKSSFYCGQK